MTETANLQQKRGKLFDVYHYILKFTGTKLLFNGFISVAPADKETQTFYYSVC